MAFWWAWRLFLFFRTITRFFLSHFFYLFLSIRAHRTHKYYTCIGQSIIAWWLIQLLNWYDMTLVTGKRMLIVPIALGDVEKRKHCNIYRYSYHWRASLIETRSNQSALIAIVQFAQRHEAHCHTHTYRHTPSLAIISICFFAPAQSFHCIYAWLDAVAPRTRMGCTHVWPFVTNWQNIRLFFF